ncbi:hypothetical protein [Devosia crocina]|nr:hypothetical protein [Devosia crocina]
MDDLLRAVNVTEEERQEMRREILEDIARERGKDADEAGKPK